MAPSLLLLAALASQAPAASPDGTTPVRAEEAASLSVEELARARAENEAATERLGKIASDEAPLPAPDELKRLLGVSNVQLGTLRERANELRVALKASAPPAPSGDAGVPGDGGPPALAADNVVRARLEAELAVLERAMAEEFRRSQGEIELLLEQEQMKRQQAEQQAKNAAAARESALREAANARTSLLERTFGRVAAIEGTRARVAAQQAEAHNRTAGILEHVRERRAVADKLLADARALPKRSDKADEMLMRVLDEEQEMLAGVEEALAQRKEPLGMHEEVIALADDAERDRAALLQSLGANDAVKTQEAIDTERDALARLQAEEITLQNELADRWYRVAEQRLLVAERLNDARLVLIEHASASGRERLRSLSDLGAKNVAAALRHLSTQIRFHLARRFHEARHLPKVLEDPIRLTKLVWAAGSMLVLLLLATWLWRRAPEFYKQSKKGIVASARTARSVRFRNAVLSVLEAALPRVFLIVVALWLYDIAAPVGPELELRFALQVFLWVVSYQLAARLLHMLILRLARRRYSLTVPQKLKILRSVRYALRYGFVMAFLLSLTESLVGRGVLYEGARILGFIGMLPLVAVLVQRWRADIVRAYLAWSPEGRLARLVDRTGDRWYGFFVALAAFAFVAGHGLATLSRDFVLGFEQTRRALAFLFRLRIERQARERGSPEPAAVEDLPDDVRDAFPDGPTDDKRLLIDRFEACKRVVTIAEGFPAAAGAIIVHARYGTGRSTWMRHLEEDLAGSLPPVRIELQQRALDEAALCARLGEPLGVETAPDVATLASALNAAPPRAVLLDGLEWLFLRELGGYAAVDALVDLVQRTRGRVLWVLSSPTVAWDHLRRVRLLDQHIQQVIELPRWSEQDIRELIQQRQRACGHPVSFEDLLVRDLEGTTTAAQVVETEDGYIRLLWNFAEGNPRVAQLFWLRSLSRAPGGELRVRLYDAPGAQALEVLGERDRFVLNALYLHRALTTAETARACRLREDDVRSSFARGVDIGLFVVNDESGRARITLPWWEATLRYLRRKNLL